MSFFSYNNDGILEIDEKFQLDAELSKLFYCYEPKLRFSKVLYERCYENKVEIGIEYNFNTLRFMSYDVSSDLEAFNNTVSAHIIMPH